MAPSPHQAGALPLQQTGAPPLNNQGGPAPLSSTLNPGDLNHTHLGSQPGKSNLLSAMDCYPPGGFMSYFQTGQQPLMPPHGQFPAPWPTVGKEIQLAPPSNDLRTQDAKARPKGRSIINIDDGNDVRTAKRLVFEPDEDLRLVSAWLFHSNDPINGNCKKNESYWADVHELYNSTTPTNRKRQVKHLKDRWQKIKRWVGFFCASWTKATSVYASGQSDDQLRDKALQFYLDDYSKEGPFTVMHCWKALRDEPKWHAILDDVDKSNKRRLDDGDVGRDISGTPEDVGEKERPIGTKEAKKQRSGKGEAKDDDTKLNEDLKKYMDIQAAATKRHEEFLETQQRVSDAKVEAARLRREAVLLEDMFMAEQSILNSFAKRIDMKIKARLESDPSRRQHGPRKYHFRDHEAAHDQLEADYFSENPLYSDAMFRRRFRMRRHVFKRIMDALGQWSPYFTLRKDCTNRTGLSPLQKCTAAIRMLAYGTPADMLDEYLKIAETTALECLENFVEGVIAVFGTRYLRCPTTEDMERLLQVGESRGFPGMLGSIDCMHWRWENCPTAWKGQFVTGRYGVPTIILEALRIISIFGMHSNNDINVLNQSPLFTEVIKGEAPRVQFSVNGKQYNTGYYLADGIYPEWAAFVKSVREPQLQKHKVYAKQQEGARKDVERAFRVLQARFNIVRFPARSWSMKVLRNIMKACVILHNMIVEDEGEMVEQPIDLNAVPGASIVLPPEVQKATNSNPCFNDVRRRNSAIRDHSVHTHLKNDLIEHIWQRFGSTQ
ncbi:LOW QUALITY PROTEIN: hypothetical protein U9M48_000748 [Paspalum notatum var. saurae]|uniref:No apical meristem-associated C-terminal domain-containing protein n=1 Tax=Paspalum notatum var. saurae TaxID=547442 RepID=A0AAQ3SER4_PASNO